MYAVRYYRMFIRKDGLMTENKSSALLFNTLTEAEDYVKLWKINSGVQITGTLPIEVVEVEAKVVCSKVKGVVSTL